MNRMRGFAMAGFLVVVGILAQGCGGVSGSHSVSPASLFLPGLMKNDTPPPPAPGEPGRDLPISPKTEDSGSLPT